MRRMSGILVSLGIAASGAGGLAPATALAGFGDVTLIHTGDIHGHLVPRPNVRSDTTGKMEGGVARMYTVIQQIRQKAREAHVDKALLINTGDTVQGSGEALFTRGQAMIDVLNLFGFDAFAPGNWDFLYGTARFEESFKGTGGNPPLAPWGALASNLYYTNQFDDSAMCGVTGTDPTTNAVRPLKRVLPTYTIKQVGKVKVGILGFTTARAIAAVGTTVTQNYRFTDGQTELPCFIDVLRNQEKVDLLVMISELELGRDIKLAESFPGVDVILNSDMHERTIEPIVASTGTLLVEEGQDGTMVGELNLKVANGKVKQWKWTPHIITDNIREDRTIARKVAEVRKPFLTGTFVPGQQVTVGGNTTELLHPVDEVIAYTDLNLHRSNFVDEDMPAVVEGSSHDLIADAMAIIGQAQSASIRGFRYGTHVPAGWPITMEDIYHYVPIAAKLGRTDKACGADLKFAIENSTYGTFSPDPTQWTGGWMFGYSGLTMDVDACDGFMGAAPVPVTGPTLANPSAPWSTNRGSSVKVSGIPIDDHELYDNRATSPTFQKCLPSDGSAARDGYTVNGYWYADDPTTINNCGPCRGRTIQVVKTDGSIVQVAGPGATGMLPNSLEVMDITEAVVKYLREDLGGLVTADNLPIHRLTVKRLPTINPFPFDVIQPLRGASPETCPLLP
jgi:sulfur-oxidizing protein SoxB